MHRLSQIYATRSSAALGFIVNLAILTLSSATKRDTDPCQSWAPDAVYADDDVCFQLHTEKLSFGEAAERCLAEPSGHLAELRTDDMRLVAIRMVLQQTFKDNRDLHAWLGARDLYEDGIWRWMSDNSSSILPSMQWWLKMRPHKKNGITHNCLSLILPGLILDGANCADKNAYICQKFMPEFKHTYVMALPNSTLSVIDSALLSASPAQSQLGRITVEVTINPVGDVRQISVNSQKGLQYPIPLDSERNSALVRSTGPLHLVLVLWSYDLTAISSSLLLPVDMSNLPVSLLGHPPSGELNLGITGSEDVEVLLGLAFSGGARNAGFSVGETLYSDRPWASVSANISQHQPLFVDAVTGYSRAPFVHGSGPMSVFSSENQPSTHNTDVTFEQILTTYQVGSEYVTIPSLPMRADVKDTFTVVAVHDDTRVKVPSPGTRSGFDYLVLDKAGDTADLELFANAFRDVSGSKTFYLYATYSAAGRSHQCQVTLLALHLWSSRYTVHMDNPWTSLNRVHVTVVGESFDTAQVRLKAIGQGGTGTTPKCVNVKAAKYTGCFFRLDPKAESYRLYSTNGGRFAAYMFGANHHASACHQLGTDTDRVKERSAAFKAEAFLQFVRTNSPDKSPEIQISVGESMEQSSTTKDRPFTAKESSTNSKDSPSNDKENSTNSVDSPSTDKESSTNSKDSLSTDTKSPTNSTDSPITATSNTDTRGVGATTARPECGYKGSNLTFSSKEFQKMIQNLSTYLRVDKLKTSQTRRRKESAPDPRVSSMCLAAISYILLLAVLGSIVLNDVIHVLTFLWSKLQVEQ